MNYEKIVQRSPAEWHERAELIAEAFDQLGPPAIDWLNQIIDLLHQGEDAAAKERIADLTEAIRESSPALTGTFGTGPQLASIVQWFVVLAYLTHEGIGLENAPAFLGPLFPQRWPALPDTRDVREELGQPGRVGRPFGPGTIDYFARREDFVAKLNETASKIEAHFPLTLEKISEHWNVDERRLRDAFDYYGVDWKAYRRARRDRRGR